MPSKPRKAILDWAKRTEPQRRAETAARPEQTDPLYGNPIPTVADPNGLDHRPNKKK